MFDLKVGFTCNNDCIHCVVGNKRSTEDLSFQEIKDIIDKITSDSFKETEIQLTGGEISIREDFLDILKYCKKKHLRVSVQTNGTGFANEELTKKAGCYIDMVLIAIHSCYPDIHNKIVGNVRDSKSMFDLTLRGLDNLIKYNIPFQTQTVISTLNINNIYDTYCYIQKRAPGAIMHLTYPHPMGNAHVNRDIVVPKYSSIKKYITPIVRDFGNKVLLEAIPPCYIFPYYLNIAGLIDSDVKQNLVKRQGFDKSNGNNPLFKEGFTENYNNNDITSKKKAPRCLECFYNKECAGVWKEYVDYYKDSLDLLPVKELNETSVDSIYIKAPRLLDIDFNELQKTNYKRNIITTEQFHFSDIDTFKKDIEDINYILNIESIEISSIEEICKQDINIFLHLKDTSQISLLNSLLEIFERIETSKSIFYVDIEASLETDSILQSLYLLQDISSYVKNLPVRILNSEGFISERQYEELLLRLNFLSGEIPYLSIPVSFVNLPNCLLGKTSINRSSLYLYSIISDLREVKFEFLEKTIKNKEIITINNGYTNICSNCKLKNVCLGFNDKFPLNLKIQTQYTN